MASGDGLPSRLGIFLVDAATGAVLTRRAVYAEVEVPVRPARGSLPVRLRSVLDEAVHGSGALPADEADRVVAAIEDALAETLPQDELERLETQPDEVRELVEEIVHGILEHVPGGSTDQLSDGELSEATATVLRRAAEARGLPVRPPVSGAWRNPLGVLVSDHAGYVSFDLTRLAPAARGLLAGAVAELRSGGAGPLGVAVRVHPFGGERLDVLPQGRLADDAVVGLVHALGADLPVEAVSGLPAMQRPGLTDWLLSPGSFAANPQQLVGGDGCEHLFPAALALQEFVLRQVVRIVDPSDDLRVPDGFRAAYVDEYKVTWHALGHSLGEIRYSLPLAPGESVRLAVIDWSWQAGTTRTEDTALEETLRHETSRDRTVAETVQAALRETQRGSSFMGGTAGSVGGSAGADVGVVGIGAAAGNTFSLGGSTATTSGSRDLVAENVQRLSDDFAQTSAARRELQSTVVVQAQETQSQTIQTRTFTNYNRAHTLTVLYHEVLRHYRVTTEWVRRRHAVLAKLPALVDFDADRARQHRWQLEPALLDPTVAPGFAAIEKLRAAKADLTRRGIPNGVAPTPGFWEGDLEFEMFELGIKSRDGEGTEEPVVGYVVVPGTGLAEKKYELHYVYKGASPVGGLHDLNKGGRFESSATIWTFVKPHDPVTGRHVPVRWGDILGFQFEKWGDDDVWRVDWLTINGLGANGLFVSLTEGSRDVDLWFEDEEPGGSEAFTWIKRPAPRQPDNPGIPGADAALTPEEHASIDRLVTHLQSAREHYNRVLRLTTDPGALARAFESQQWTAGVSMDEAVLPRPLEVFGSYVAYPLARQPSDEEVERRAGALRARSEVLITMPTRGVFAEGKLGHCSVAEEIDNTRFWKWEEHPLPITPSEIAPAVPVAPTPQQQDATPTAFPAPVVTVVAPGQAPDPTGLAAALDLLGRPEIFRDMSSRAEVADLLARLSDNTISIAEAANRARQITGGGGR
ncbi:hypothetical protein E9549_17795 [Blastococcus sp. MG754426]|nr:hypothetical protein [Blastococcus sp. MG754426]MCF6509240.1 hypothetical protein [Blastococcus sp. MG754426]